MPPGPPSPAIMPTSRNTSSNGAPKRNAIRLDRMPARTSRLPSKMAKLTLSSEAITRISFRYRKVSRAQEQRETLPRLSRSSKSHLVAALEREDFPRLIRARDLQPEALENFADICDLLSIRLGQLARANPERILHADPHIAAHRRGHSRHAHLVGACAQHRPMIVVTQQPVGGALHHDDIFGMRTDATENAEDRLHKQWRLYQAAVEEMPQGIEMADIVALDLKAGAVPGAGAQDVLDVGKSILEHSAARPFQIGLLPIVFELALVARDHRIKPEVHRPHIE